MSNFAENLRKAIFNKRCKAVDVSRGTNIRPSVISRYLSGINQPSTGNLFAIAEYLGVSPNTLLSSSDAPESSESSRHISSSDKDKVIAVQEELIQKFRQENEELRQNIKKWEEWKASIMAITIPEKDRHAKGREKTKNPTKPNKQKVGFLKKHKKPKK